MPWHSELGISIEADAAGIGIPASDIPVLYRTGFPWYRTGSGICILFSLLPDWLDAERSGIPAFTKTVRSLKGVHPACPYCLRWKDTQHVHTACSGKMPCSSILQCKEPIPKIWNKYSQERIARPQSQFPFHVSVSDLYIPTIELPYSAAGNVWTDPGNL
jgi:hypothetical protein